MRGLIAQVQYDLGMGTLVQWKLADGPAESYTRGPDQLLHIRGNGHSARLPVRGLGTQLVDLASGQFDAEMIGFLAFHESAGGSHEPTAAINFPGDNQATTLIDAAADGHMAGLQQDLRGPGHVIRT